MIFLYMGKIGLFCGRYRRMEGEEGFGKGFLLSRIFETKFSLCIILKKNYYSHGKDIEKEEKYFELKDFMLFKKTFKKFEKKERILGE